MNLGYIITHPKKRASQCNGNSIDIHNPQNFSDLHGILIVDWLSTGMTINSDVYCETLTKQVQIPAPMQGKMDRQSHVTKQRGELYRPVTKPVRH